MSPQQNQYDEPRATCPDCNETFTIVPEKPSTICPECGTNVDQAIKRENDKARATQQEIKQALKDLSVEYRTSYRIGNRAVQFTLVLDGPVKHVDDPLESASAERVKARDTVATVRKALDEMKEVSGVEVYFPGEQRVDGSMFGVEPNTESLDKNECYLVAGVS